MPLLYDLSIGAFNLAIKIAGACGNTKARHLHQGRRSLVEYIERQMAQSGGARSVWIHCASLGEFEQGRPLIEALRQQRPEQPIVVTFFSPSGYEVRKGYAGADHIFYLPADTPSNARRVVRALNPEMAIFVKYEYWFHYLSELQRVGTPSYVVSAIFRPGMIFFKPWGGVMRRTIGLLSHLFVQDPQSEELLESIGIHRVTVTGDTRFDRVAAIVQSAPAIPAVAEFAAVSGHMTLIAGSTWPADEQLLLTLKESAPAMRMVVAPHEVAEPRIADLVAQATAAGYTVTRYTELPKELTPQSIESLRHSDMLIIDTIGLLSGVYQYGQVAYIGGGFGRGIHNTLEAATWGMPIIFGPRYGAFAEAVSMVKEGVAHPIKDAGELQRIVCEMIASPDKIRSQGAAAAKYVKSRTGATKAILSHI